MGVIVKYLVHLIVYVYVLYAFFNAAVHRIKYFQCTLQPTDLLLLHVSLITDLNTGGFLIRLDVSFCTLSVKGMVDTNSQRLVLQGHSTHQVGEKCFLSMGKTSTERMFTIR